MGLRLVLYLVCQDNLTEKKTFSVTKLVCFRTILFCVSSHSENLFTTENHIGLLSTGWPDDLTISDKVILLDRVKKLFYQIQSCVRWRTDLIGESNPVWISFVVHRLVEQGLCRSLGACSFIPLPELTAHSLSVRPHFLLNTPSVGPSVLPEKSNRHIGTSKYVYHYIIQTRK